MVLLIFLVNTVYTSKLYVSTSWITVNTRLPTNVDIKAIANHNILQIPKSSAPPPYFPYTDDFLPHYQSIYSLYTLALKKYWESLSVIW